MRVSPPQPVEDTRSQPEGSAELLEGAALDQGFDPIERDDPRLPRRSSDMPQRAADHFRGGGRLWRLDFCIAI